MTLYSRRNILATSAAGSLAAAAVISGSSAETYSAAAISDPGPHDPAQEAINPYDWQSLPTDNGNLGTLRHSFSQVHNRHTDAGWAREVTVRNFPISKAMAGVNMRLPAGAVRELHWHVPAEWAFVTYGSGRITAVDSSAQKFISDVKEGDLWFFPGGVPHSIQGLGPDGCEFILVFNDGNFSEDSTFLITDWFNHTPKEVLAKNFGVPASTFDNTPKKDLWIFNAPVPGSLADDLAQSKQPFVPNPYAFSLGDQKPVFQSAGGSVRIADSQNFKATTMAAALVEVAPGGLRELHCIRALTNGNITSVAQPAWGSSTAKVETIRSNSTRATSAMCRSRLDIISRTSARTRSASWRFSQPLNMPTSRWRHG